MSAPTAEERDQEDYVAVDNSLTSDQVAKKGNKIKKKKSMSLETYGVQRTN